jgi:hypothetical protein
MKWGSLKVWQKTVFALVIFAVAITVFLYGYAFLYDYLYAKNFPQIPVTAYSTKSDPTKFSDPVASLTVEIANALQRMLS